MSTTNSNMDIGQQTTNHWSFNNQITDKPHNWKNLQVDTSLDKLTIIYFYVSLEDYNWIMKQTVNVSQRERIYKIFSIFHLWATPQFSMNQ